MAQPADITQRVIRVLNADGTAATGLTLAAFTVDAYGRGYGAGVWTTYASGAAVTEIGGGLYGLSFALPASAGWWRFEIRPVVTTRIVYSGIWEGETETQDLDSLYGQVVRPVATLTQGAQLGSTVSLDLVANRFRQLAIPIVTQSGAPYDLSVVTVGSLRMSVRSKNQTTTKWDAGPTGTISLGTGTAANFVITHSGVAGALSVEIPEDSGFFAALAAGEDTIDLYWEVTGDLGGVAAKTIPIIRSSPLQLRRREVGT